MKGFFAITIFIIFHVTCAKGQASIHDYVQTIIDFTEKNQNLEAIKLCNKLINIYPDNADLYYLKGINNYILKNYDDAIADFDKTIKINSEYDDAYLYRAKAKKAHNDYFGALRDYNKAKDENFSQTVSSLAGDVIRSVFSGKKD